MISRIQGACLTATLVAVAVSPNIAQAAETTGQSAEPAGLQEVVVTAQRREESLQKAALAVSVVSADELLSRGVVAPEDLTKLIPALKLESLSSGSLQVTVRGVGSFAGNAQAETGVAINYDGVYLARAQAANTQFHDLERVELLKGPQGTLYGRNATAGALNIITRKPTFDGEHFDAMVETGNYSLARGSFAANIPVSSTVALRFAAQGISRDGYLSDGYNNDKNWSARAHVLWKPNEDWSALLSSDFAKVTGKGTAAVLSPFLNPGDPYEGPSAGRLNAVLSGFGQFIGVPLPPVLADGFLDQQVWGLSSTIEYHPGTVALTIIPSYRAVKTDDLHYGAGFPVTNRIDSKEKTLEVRLASESVSDWRWVVGAYYFNESTPYELDYDQGVTAADNNLRELDTISWAGFGQLTYSVTSAFRLTGGVRYSREHKTQEGFVASSLPNVPPAFYPFVCPPPATIDLPALNCNAPFTGDLTFNSTTWKAGGEYDLAPNSLLYGNVSTGFKAGGFFNSLPPNTFEPEKLTAYTLGSKNRFLDNRLQLNVESFYWTYKNKQVSHLAAVRPAGYNLVTDNAGSATIYGLELEGIWAITPDDRVTSTVAFDHSVYDTFRFDSANPAGAPAPATGCGFTSSPGGGPGQGFFTIDCSGRPVSFSPKWVATLGVEHTFHLPSGSELVPAAFARYESSSWLGDEFLAGQLQKSSTIVDASVTWKAPADAWSAQAYINNIADKAVGAGSFVQSVIGLPLITLRAPRTYGIRVAYHY